MRYFEKKSPILCSIIIGNYGDYRNILKNANTTDSDLEDKISKAIGFKVFIDEAPGGKTAQLCLLNAEKSDLSSDQISKAKEIFTNAYKTAISNVKKRYESISSLRNKINESLSDNIDNQDDSFAAEDEAESILNAKPLDTVIDALDDDIVDSLDDTSEDIEDVDPTQLENESAMRKTNGLKIAESKLNDKEKLNEESYRNIVKDWIDQGGENDLDSFLDFAKEKGYDADNNPQDQNYKFKRTYRELSKDAARRASDDGAGMTPDEKRAALLKKEPHVNSAALNNLISLVGEVDDHVATAAETVNEKFRLIKSKVRRTLMGKSLKNYYLLFGDAGIGKCVQYDTEVPVRLDDAIAEEYEAWLSSQK